MNAHGRRLAAALPLAAALLAGSLACGKKGPPLPPLEGSIPRITDLEVAQLGEQVRASFTLPLRPEAEGVDYVTTAVELWRRPSEPGASAGAEIQDELDVGSFTKSAVLVDEARGEGLFEVLARPEPALIDPEPQADGAPVHEYALVLRTNLRKRGTLSNVELLEVEAPPEPPRDFRLEPLESGVLLTWTAPEPPPPPEAPESAEGEEGEEAAAPEPPTLGFNVYRAVAEKAFEPEPLNPNPVREPQFADADVSEGTSYRYSVRSVLESGDRQVLSRASETLSVDYRDEFPPAVPSGLRLIPDGARAVNLIWNPNTERDLAGYAVYRREPGGTWRRLDSGNARAASWVDAAITPGRTYEYAVSAYDGAEPPNESERTEPRSVTIPAVGAP